MHGQSDSLRIWNCDLEVIVGLHLALKQESEIRQEKQTTTPPPNPASLNKQVQRRKNKRQSDEK